MFYYLQSFVIVAIEVLCSAIFYESFGRKRYDGKYLVNYGILGLLMVIDFFIAYAFSQQFVLKELLIILAATVLMYIYCRVGMLKSFVLAVMYQIMILGIDYMSVLFTAAIFKDMTDMEYSSYGYMLVVFSKMLLFIVVMLIRKNTGNDYADILKDTEWLRFIIVPMFSICVITAMLMISGGITNQRQQDLFFVIAVFLVGINMAIFYLIGDIMKRERKSREDDLYRQQVQSSMELLNTMKENHEKQKKRAHEFKNQLLCIEALAMQEKYDELKEYIAQLGGELNSQNVYIKSNNVFVDAIINTKFSECVEKNIMLITKLSDLSTVEIIDDDIVVILSNLLNNAIEACEKCDDKRVIKLKFVIEEDEIILAVRNSHTNKIEMRDGQIVTTKSNKSEHGMGIKNIVDVINKYGGEYVIQNRDSEFYISIMFLLKNVKK